MTREPLHYWRRRRGFSLKAFVHNTKLKQIYIRDTNSIIYGESPFFALGRRSGMSMSAAIGAVCLRKP